MNMKYFAAATALASALSVSVAFAQSPPSTTKIDGNAASHNQAYKGQWRVNKVIGLDVYNRENQKLGDISEILVDQTGKIQTVIVGVGGFLGVGERLVSVSFDKLKFVDERIEPKTVSGTSTPPAPAKTVEGTSTSTTGLSATGRQTRSTGERWYPDHAVFDVTADQLKAMPQFKYN